MPAAPDSDLLRHVAAGIRSFGEAAAATTVVAVLDLSDAPAMLEWSPSEPLLLTVGEETVALRPGFGEGEAPEGLPEAEPLGLLTVDAAKAEIAAPMGAVARAAGAVATLAALLPGRSVLTAEFATSDPDAPLTIAARASDPLVLALGDEQFEMPPGWPGLSG